MVVLAEEAQTGLRKIRKVVRIRVIEERMIESHRVVLRESIRKNHLHEMMIF
tara:strand:- start:183 stop:338 length:156 start_codon:yes stop_codon:yes gene_type:complete